MWCILDGAYCVFDLFVFCFEIINFVEVKMSAGELLVIFMALSVCVVSLLLIITNQKSVTCDGSCNQGRTQCECKND